MWQYENLIKKIKKQPILVPKKSTTLVDYNRKDIQRIIPHRHPFLMIDNLTKINLDEKAIEVERYIDPNNPVFEGHFPNNPVYPGVLQLEIMGQSGLCLAHFLANNSCEITEYSKPIKGLFTKVHHALFMSPVLPNDNLTILVKMIEKDDFMGIIASQILKNNKICSLSLLEVYFDE